MPIYSILPNLKECLAMPFSGQRELSNFSYFEIRFFKSVGMKKLLVLGLLMIYFNSWSQKGDSSTEEAWRKIYRASATKINDLVHTKLDIKFDFGKARMYGKAWLTLHPHFYPTDSLNLDAKYMNINGVFLLQGGKNIPLTYTYDSTNLRIRLNKVYRANENFTVYIDYVSKPNEHVWATADIKGLYFINPTGEDKHKPTQIWTFGEPENNSSWCPTIDKPNQKTTDEIRITVPSKYVTLSNGLLVNQKMNSDGTRTDNWKLDLPFAPYLLFFAVGDYSVIKDNYKGKEVSYYVEKEYASVARRIFGLTPDMIAYYSKITGVDFPWPKYAQITGRDFVEGAQENVSATLHAEEAQQDARELADGNGWEAIIAHELFHHWFGDLVTCESWSNITVNESFANYGETLWFEYRYGKDEGDGVNYNAMKIYLGNQDDTTKDLVRFYYSDPQDVFDDVSYPKGGRILNMLRNFTGDSAFFKSLNLYLTSNKFKTAEAQNLRLAFEEVTGKDLNWFFNQWYYNHGHPKLDISYNYDESGKKASVFILQTQSVAAFKIPLAIDVYDGGIKKRYNIWINNAADTFSFPVNARPDLINVDGDKILLCEKNDHKSLDEFMYQYKHAGLYVDRIEAVKYAGKYQTDPRSLEFLLNALNDKSWRIRSLTLDELDLTNVAVKRAVEKHLLAIATNDPRKTVKAKAIKMLGRFKNPAYKPFFIKEIEDSSYSVAGSALEALALIDEAEAEEQAKKLVTQPAKGVLASALYGYLDESKFDSLTSAFESLPFGNIKYLKVAAYANFLGQVNNTGNLKKGVDIIVNFRDKIPKEYRGITDPVINGELKDLMTKKRVKGLTEQADYIKSKIPNGKS
jgi:aminopeptidase N